MNPVRLHSVAEQTAIHLRAALEKGLWRGKLPGVLKLAAEFDVSKDSVRAALRLLEVEGFVSGAGRGRPRKVHAGRGKVRSGRSLHVVILNYRPLRRENGNAQRLLLRLQHELEAAGHTCAFAQKSQECLHYDLGRMTRMVLATDADAWVVDAGSEELLEWFSRQSFPAIALGGRRAEVSLARVATDLTLALQSATRRLIALGHRRVVLICPQEWRKPRPGHLVQVFLREIAATSTQAALYHVPEWEQTAEGFESLLQSLFGITPPTALILIEPVQTVAALSYLARRGLRVPQDVSLITRTKDASLDWCRPALAHFREAEEFLVRHIERWVADAAKGKVGRERTVCEVGFDEGESISLARG